jgi:8-oxo-dGTP diphosphatase
MAKEVAAPLIQAAGAVLWRKIEGGDLEIAIVHRPKYDDWSLPKGKVEAGESHISAGYREIQEETGYESIFGPEIGTVVYKLEGAPKEVRYWSARATEMTGHPDPIEVNQVEWLVPKKAKDKLTNKDDRAIVDYFLEFGSDTFPIILLRHAKALKRTDWDGDDGDRPLAQLGQIQSMRMLSKYLPFGITEIHTSDAVRCYETVAPIARSLSLDKIYWSELSEYAFEKDKKAAINVVNDIIESEAHAIVCGHNPVIPGIVAKFIGKKNFKELDHGLMPGEAWILHHRDGEIIAIDWMPAPEA